MMAGRWLGRTPALSAEIDGDRRGGGPPPGESLAAAGPGGDGETALRGRQRAGPSGVVNAGRVIGEVEVEDDLGLAAAEICTLGGVEQIPPSPVGLGSGGCVAKG